jgi:hypothetical protein
MTDIKSTTQGRKRNRRFPHNKPQGAVQRPIPVNMMFRKNRWYYGALSSSTAGTISRGNISPSISFSSEISVLQSLYTEVRLIRARVIFTPTTNTLTAIVQGRIMIATNMLYNGTTFNTPTSLVNVQNCTRPMDCSTYGVKPLIYKMAVPRNLEYLSIIGDIPTIPAPYAGSPGCVVVWGDNLTVSTNYFQVDIEAIWQLRATQ